MTKKNVNRFIIILLLMFLGISYLYYKTLIYYEVVNCYSYDLNVYRARPSIYTVKYFYQYKDKYYFDQRRFTSHNKATPSSGAKARVCKLNPAKNYLIAERSNAPSNYDFKTPESFIDTFDIKVKNISDYYPDKFKKAILKNKKPIIYSNNLDSLEYKRIVEALDKVVFCEGSLIETFILDQELDGYKLYLIHYYLNDFSIDSKLISIYHKLISEAVNRNITIVIIDKNKEREQKIYAT